MGKFTISMVIFNSYVSHNQRVTLKKATESQVFFQNLGIFWTISWHIHFFWTMCEALAMFCDGWSILDCEDDGNDDQWQWNMINDLYISISTNNITYRIFIYIFYTSVMIRGGCDVALTVDVAEASWKSSSTRWCRGVMVVLKYGDTLTHDGS